MEQNPQTVYLMDSNSFINPYRNYYTFSFAPTFWDLLNLWAEKKVIKSISQVKREICHQIQEDKKDKLHLWFENDFKCEIIETFTDIKIIENYRKIMNYLHYQPGKYTPNAVRKWAVNKAADGWIIATAMTNKKYIIVTFENDEYSKKEPKIPIVAKDFDVDCIHLFVMMNNLKFQL
jgi:hypothetical protein